MNKKQNEKICPICKNKFETIYKRKIYCSNSCKQKNFYKNHKEERKSYREKNKERRKIQRKEYYEKNKDMLRKISREYNKNHKEVRRNYREKNKEKNKVWRDSRKDKREEYDKKYYEEHKDRIKKRKKKYGEEHKDKMKKYYDSRKDKIKKYYKEHKEERKEYDKKYRKTPNGKLSMARRKSRRRNFNDVLLMPDVYNGTCSSVGHHLLGHIPKEKEGNKTENRFFLFYIPKITHLIKHGRVANYNHWYAIGNWIKKAYCMDIGKFLNGDDFMVYHEKNR